MFQQSLGVVSSVLKRILWSTGAKRYTHTCRVCGFSVCVQIDVDPIQFGTQSVERCNPPPRGSDVGVCIASEDNTTLALNSQIRILGIVLVELEGRGVILGSEGTHSPDVTE